MDPRDRAKALLSRAQARDGVVTPDNMTSPMDASNTQQIPGAVVHRLDREADPDSTAVVDAALIEEQDSHLADSQPTTRLGGQDDDEPERTDRLGGAAEHRSAPQNHSGNAGSAGNDDVEELEEAGLVPTTRTVPVKSTVARRLEGL